MNSNEKMFLKTFATFFTVLLFLVLWGIFLGHSAPVPVPHTPSAPPAPGIQHAKMFAIHKPLGRPVVEGGIHNLDELREAMSDPTVRANFAGFDFTTAQLVTLGYSEMAFVTFRVDGKGLFWATRPVLIQKGETVWMDASGNIIRAKCGNRVAFAPGGRVLPEEEVLEAVLETPPTVYELPTSKIEHQTPPVITTKHLPPVEYLAPPVFGPVFPPRRHRKPGSPPTSGADNPLPGLQIGAGIIACVVLTRWGLRIFNQRSDGQ